MYTPKPRSRFNGISTVPLSAKDGRSIIAMAPPPAGVLYRSATSDERGGGEEVTPSSPLLTNMLYQWLCGISAKANHVFLSQWNNSHFDLTGRFTIISFRHHSDIISYAWQKEQKNGWDRSISTLAVTRGFTNPAPLASVSTIPTHHQSFSRMTVQSRESLWVPTAKIESTSFP